MSSRKIKKKKKKKIKRPIFSSNCLTANTSDKHTLYENSVQCAETSFNIINKIYEYELNCKPKTLREDFCGTASLCAKWVQSSDEHRACGIDFDSDTLEWAKTHNIDPLEDDIKSRVELVEADVLNAKNLGYDVINAFNFSYWTFQKRDVLKSYFKSVIDSLNDNGLFLMDSYGGPDSQFVMEEERELDGFNYVWDQEYVDPINNNIICKIHYRFPDGSEIKDAFTYDWRIWSIPELKDILKEVGFKKVVIWWDCQDDELRPKEKVENLVSWISYIAAWK